MGEILSIIVAVIWTITALFAEVGSKRFGAIQMNVLRMAGTLLFLGVALWVLTGSVCPVGMSPAAWGWFLASGLVGFVLGDWCLFNSYVVMGSRFGQLMMTLAPLFAAFAGWAMLGEQLTLQAWLGMAITMAGIAIAVHDKPATSAQPASVAQPAAAGVSLRESQPPRFSLVGFLLGLGAAAGQGVGIVLSKMGMVLYTSDYAAVSGTFVRSVAGLAGFLLIYWWRGDRHRMRNGLHDKVAVQSALGAIITGPCIGVSLSLFAVTLAPAGVASTLMALTPIFILWPSKWLFGQPVTARQVLGTVVAVAGTAVLCL